MAILTETYKLANGRTIPKLGFGTWQIPEGEIAYQSVRWALEAGYTHIDTAVVYGNEASCGRAVRDFGAERESLYVTSKVPAEIKDYDQAVAAIRGSLETLDLGYIDLMLIHAPRPWSEMHDPDAPRRHEGNQAVWRALEEAYERGELRAIGVSNFAVDDIENIESMAEVGPMVNQIRLHPGFMQPDIVAGCEARGIVVEAYSPLATGRLLERPELTEIAKRYNVTVAQLSLRYLLDHGLLPLPKSTHEQYIRENAALDFVLEARDREAIDALEE